MSTAFRDVVGSENGARLHHSGRRWLCEIRCEPVSLRATPRVVSSIGIPQGLTAARVRRLWQVRGESFYAVSEQGLVERVVFGKNKFLPHDPLDKEGVNIFPFADDANEAVRLHNRALNLAPGSDAGATEREC